MMILEGMMIRLQLRLTSGKKLVTEIAKREKNDDYDENDKVMKMRTTK